RIIGAAGDSPEPHCAAGYESDSERKRIPRSPPHQSLPPAGLAPNREAHLLVERMQVKLHEVREAAFEDEIRHAAGRLRRLVGVAAEADRQFAEAAVDFDPIVAVAQHVRSWSRNR